MIQKTYQIYDFENGEFEKVLQEVQDMPAYRDAAQVLLVIYEQNWDRGRILWKTEQIRKKLPKAEITGLNHRNEWDFGKLKQECSILSFLFFEKKAFKIWRKSFQDVTDRQAGEALNHVMKAQEHVRGVMICLSEVFRNIEDVLEEAEKGLEDVPIFGAPSAYLAFQFETEHSYVFDEEEVYENFILAVIFYGEDLHLKVSYNYGWTPVGKQMKITKMDGAYHVLEIDQKPAAQIYEKYLGLEDSSPLVYNISEFPLIIEKEGKVPLPRIPIACEPDGSLYFMAPFHEGDCIRFSYGVINEILSQVYYDSYRFRDFVPQGMFLVVCMNRVLFLKELEGQEIDYYKQLGNALAYLHGNSEIYRFHGEGGEMNSALIAVGIREGAAGKPLSGKYSTCTLKPEERKRQKQDEPGQIAEPFQVPLEHRIMNFMRAVTSDLEELASEAQVANKAKSSFLSSMSHEIRTPINAVLGLNEMILRESKEKQIRDYAMDIQRAGKLLLSLINEILDISKIESGKMEIVPEQYDLSSLIHDLSQMTVIRARSKDLEFSVKVDPDLPAELYGDDVRLKQILTNILTNAVKYTKKGRVMLRVSGQRKGDAEILHCEVEDTGIGMKPEDLPKLFEEFQRIEEKRNRSIEGTGLGMSITYKLLYMMGSQLEVESVYGEGTKFWFDLEQQIVNDTPIGDFEERIRGLSDEYHYTHSFTAPDARIMIVDDNDLNLKVVCNLLKDTKMKITAATSGRQCLDIAAKRQFHIIFLDHMMPEMDGIEVLKRLREMKDSPNADTPIYALTANAVAGARESYMKAGFQGFLSKPVDAGKLEALIRKELPEELIKS